MPSSRSRSQSLLLMCVIPFLLTSLMLIRLVDSQCGFPGIPEGVMVSRQSRLSLTYFEGESIFASCAFITTTRKSIMHDNNSRQLQRQFNVSPAFTVNYTLKCFEKQWIIKSSPENISWRSCPKPGKDITVTTIKATSLDDSIFVPVLFENDRSNCYTGAIDIPQKWVISLSHEVYPCFISILLSTPGRQKRPSSESTLQVMDESGNYNCSFLRYIYESMIEVQREKTRRNLRALFVCSSRVPDLITSERPGIQSLRLQLQSEEEPQNEDRYSYQHSSLFTQVSFCGIEVHECASSCGSFPLPVKGSAREERMNPRESLQEDGQMTWKSRVKYSCGDEGDEGSFDMKTTDEYDQFDGLVCSFDGSWMTSSPECLIKPSVSFTSLFLNFLAIPSDCISCVSLLCLFLLLIIVVVFFVAMFAFNYLWIRRREKDESLHGKQSLLWIRRNFLTSTSLNECNPRGSLIREPGVEGSHPRKKRLERQKRKNTSSNLFGCDPCHSYIDMQGSIFDEDLGIESESIPSSNPSSCCSTLTNVNVNNNNNNHVEQKAVTQTSCKEDMLNVPQL